MLDILANKKEIPCSRNTLVCLKNAARDAYDKAKETDKPQLAGIAAKISCFLEAVDKKGISGILRDDGILFSENPELPPFLSNTEKEMNCQFILSYYFGKILFLLKETTIFREWKAKKSHRAALSLIYHVFIKFLPFYSYTNPKVVKY